MTVHRILRAEGMRPYHVRKVQDLLAGDHSLRVAFCEEIIKI